MGLRLRELDWRWIERQFVLVVLVFTPIFVGKSVFLTIAGHGWGFDYHGGIWQAGRDILAGRNPYPAPMPLKLLVPGNALITPPLLPLLNLPLAIIPFWIAVSVWNALQTAALILALRLCGLRDWRGYVLAIGSIPFVASLGLGQPDGLFALAVATAWRYRDRWVSGMAVGMLIAAKLLLWPLLIWLVLTRRFRAAMVGVAAAAAGLVLPWAAIRFQGMSTYAQLLDADTKAFAARSQSVMALLIREGVQQHPARVVATALAVFISTALAWHGRRSDVGLFAAMLVAGLLVSPIMWSHYLVLLLIPLALTHRTPDYAWLAYALLWASPTEPPSSPTQIGAVIALTCLLTWEFGRSRSKALTDGREHWREGLQPSGQPHSVSIPGS